MLQPAVSFGGNSVRPTSQTSYDALNRLATLEEQTAPEFGANETGRTTSYGYDLNGNIVGKVAPAGDTETYAYDPLNRTTVETANAGNNAPLFTYAYGYDLAGNVLTVGEQYPSGLNNRTTTNTYDAINRLQVEAVTGNAPNSSTTYTYDAANNRLSKTVTGAGAIAVNYSYNSLNQLTGYTDNTNRAVALTYDADGNRTSRTISGGPDNGTDSYSYDFENRLIAVAKGTGGGGTGTYTYAYQYDYRTRRVVRNESGAGGATTAIVFSGGTSVQEYDNGAGTPTVEYVRGSDYGGGVGGILYTLRGGIESYTHANKRGDIVTKTDGSGNLTFQDQYDGNGDQVATDGATQDRQKDNSKDCDPWGGINEGMRYTTIEEGLRVFLTRDPMGTQLMMGKDTWYLDNKEVTHQKYEDALYPGTFMDTNPSKSARSSKDENDYHVEANIDGNAALGNLNHFHIIIPGQPNIYLYVKDNPWTLFDPEGLDPNQSVWIDLAHDQLHLYNGTGANRQEVLTAPTVHGAGTTKANTTSTGNFTLGAWQSDKTNSAYGSMTSTPWSQSLIGHNAYGPYFTPIVGSNGDGIHGTMGLSYGTWWLTSRISSSSHGCVRIPNDKIIEMHDKLLTNPVGTKVTITNDPKLTAPPPVK